MNPGAGISFKLFPLQETQGCKLPLRFNSVCLGKDVNTTITAPFQPSFGVKKGTKMVNRSFWMDFFNNY